MSSTGNFKSENVDGVRGHRANIRTGCTRCYRRAKYQGLEMCCRCCLQSISLVNQLISARKASSAPIKNVVQSWRIDGTEENLQVTAKTTVRKRTLLVGRTRMAAAHRARIHHLVIVARFELDRGHPEVQVQRVAVPDHSLAQASVVSDRFRSWKIPERCQPKYSALPLFGPRS